MTKIKIEAETLLRDEYGFFKHSEFPALGENDDTSSIENWFHDRNGSYECLSINNASTEVEELYYEISDCNLWKPVCDKLGSFLLSIHDTDNGPIAVFFVPNSL